MALHKLIIAQQERRSQGDAAGAATVVRQEGVPLWMEILQHARAAVLSFQHTVATRNDLGMLASIHNKFVRIATFRFRASLLEFLDELPPEAEAAYAAALAPDTELLAAVFVPTRPTRLAPGETVTVTAIAPGQLEVVDVGLLLAEARQRGLAVRPYGAGGAPNLCNDGNHACWRRRHRVLRRGRFCQLSGAAA